MKPINIYMWSPPQPHNSDALVAGKRLTPLQSAYPFPPADSVAQSPAESVANSVANSAHLHNHIGNLSKHYKNDIEGAEAAYRRDINIDPNYPDYPDAHNNLGLLLIHDKNYIDGSEAAFRQAIHININPNYTDARTNMYLLKKHRKHVIKQKTIFINKLQQ